MVGFAEHRQTKSRFEKEAHSDRFERPAANAVAPKALRVLLVEDTEDDASLVLRALRLGGYAPTWKRVQSAEDMREALRSEQWDLILSDYSMPRFNAPGALAVAKEHAADIPFIIVSGTVGEDVAVETVRAGARDYVLKDALVRLVPAVERELEEAAARRERRIVEERLALSDRMLRQSQKMEAIGRLAAGVAHDFNNMLAVIAGYSGLLLADLGPEDASREKIEEIHSAAMRSADLTRQLLAFSRQQVLEPRVVDLNEIVSAVERMLRRVIGADVALAIQKGDGLGRVKVDPGQVEQVILNLVVNARDAMPNGGRLTIVTANADLDEAQLRLHPEIEPGAFVMLSVADSGTGMSEEVQSRVFEPFFTTKEAGKGTGLGLSTVFGIVRQSGGVIQLSSRVGEGTTFYVYLPRSEEPLAAPAASDRAPDLRGDETILLVDDEPTVRRAVRTVLRKYGYSVIECGTAEQALEQCRSSERIDLLVTDVMMPGMTGRDLASRVASLRSSLPVLYTSGHTELQNTRQNDLEAGAHFLQKPFTPDALARKVRQVLRG